MCSRSGGFFGIFEYNMCIGAHKPYGFFLSSYYHNYSVRPPLALGTLDYWPISRNYLLWLQLSLSRPFMSEHAPKTNLIERSTNASN